MKKAQPPNWVTAVFQNAAVSIEFARKTTLAQVAEQLSALGDIHGKSASAGSGPGHRTSL
jgi:hypothetical protein